MTKYNNNTICFNCFKYDNISSGSTEDENIAAHMHVNISRFS